jgi:hypothetical protein
VERKTVGLGGNIRKVKSQSPSMFKHIKSLCKGVLRKDCLGLTNLPVNTNAK